MEKIEFNKIGYDPLIDYIKGLCIIFVVMTHSMNRSELGLILFPFWGDAAVPIFLMIQVFHYYKKGFNITLPNAFKLWKRVVFPYILIIAFMFLALFFIYYDITDGVFSPKLYWDKRGPGSYYFFIYLEFSLIIPLFAPLFKKLSWKWCLVFFVFLSQLVEMISSITHCPDNIYRILFVRYIFLIFLGYLMATTGIEINKYTIFAGIISFFFLYIFNYTNIDLEPFFYTSLDNWKYCHWICYIYIFYIILWLFKKTFMKLKANNIILVGIVKIGKYSYEIYLFQIFYYATISIFVNNSLSIIDDFLFRKILYVAFSVAICICLPLLYYIVKRKFYIRISS